MMSGRTTTSSSWAATRSWAPNWWRAREAFGIDLTLRDLLKAPTVAELASVIERLAIQRVEAMSEQEARLLAAIQ